jgi:hypothetical protein
MCWVGIDRAIKIAEALGEGASLDEWGQLRDEIRGDVLENGFDREQGAFVQSYGSRGLDASAMLLPLVRFIRADDPKMRSTVAAIQERLTTGGLVHRYLAEDGLPGDEGAFVICSFWLADNLALQGRHDEARLLFERVCSFANDVGLLSEHKSSTEALRSLKRQLAKVVYRRMVADRARRLEPSLTYRRSIRSLLVRLVPLRRSRARIDRSETRHGASHKESQAQAAIAARIIEVTNRHPQSAACAYDA